MADTSRTGEAPVLLRAVEKSLAAAALPDRDAATADLARHYAAALDTDADTAKVGPLLLAALDALLLTPKSRATARKAPTDDQPQRHSPLDELRARRDARGG